MSRPEVVVGVCGTATEVGKTYVGAALARALRACGRTVVARKPLQSFEPDDLHPTDAEVLAAATGEDPREVCAPDRWLPVPMAPPMAAEVLGRPCPSVADIVAGLSWPAVDVGLLETVGGVRSPLAADGDSRDLVRAAGVDVVLVVADAGLGTIDAVRGAVDQLAPLRVVTVLNRFDGAVDLHERNRRWLVERDGLEVVVDVEQLAIRLLR